MCCVCVCKENVLIATFHTIQTITPFPFPSCLSLEEKEWHGKKGELCAWMKCAQGERIQCNFISCFQLYRIWFYLWFYPTVYAFYGNSWYRKESHKIIETFFSFSLFECNRSIWFEGNKNFSRFFYEMQFKQQNNSKAHINIDGT